MFARLLTHFSPICLHVLLTSKISIRPDSVKNQLIFNVFRRCRNGTFDWNESIRLFFLLENPELLRDYWQYLKLTSHGILHYSDYLWLADLTESFFQSLMSIFIFSQHFLNRFCSVEKCGVTPHCLYYDSLTLTLSWRRSVSYRNQSIDLHMKSMDWFLFVKDLYHERV